MTSPSADPSRSTRIDVVGPRTLSGAGADCVEPEKGSDGTREPVAQASRRVKTTAAITIGMMAQAAKTAMACQC